MQPDEGSGGPRDWRDEQRRDLRLYCGLALSGPVPQRHQLDRQLHVDWLPPAHDGQPMVTGGDLYPTLIRKNPIKPITIFLQDGSADLDNRTATGSWRTSRCCPRSPSRTRWPTPRRCPARDMRSSTSGATARIPTRMGDRCSPTFFGWIWREDDCHQEDSAFLRLTRLWLTI